MSHYGIRPQLRNKLSFFGSFDKWAVATQSSLLDKSHSPIHIHIIKALLSTVSHIINMRHSRKTLWHDWRIEPSTFWLMDDPLYLLSHSRPYKLFLLMIWRQELKLGFVDPSVDKKNYEFLGEENNTFIKRHWNLNSKSPSGQP